MELNAKLNREKEENKNINKKNNKESDAKNNTYINSKWFVFKYRVKCK